MIKSESLEGGENLTRGFEPGVRLHYEEEEMSELEKVMDEYRRTPTDAVVSDLIILTRSDPDATRRAAAAVLGFSRGGYYLDTARSLIDQIMEDAKEISWRMQAYDLMFSDLEKRYQAGEQPLDEMKRSVTIKLGAQYLSISAELLWHFYSSSLSHAWHLMANSASESIDHHIDSDLTCRRSRMAMEKIRVGWTK